MHRSLIRFAPLFSLLFLLSTHADQIDNPQYKAWASLKPGTSVTMATTTSANGQSVKMETKTTLATVADDKVTLTIDSSMDVNGSKMNIPSQTRDVKKTMDSTVNQGPAQITPDALAKATEESVTVAAGTFKAKAVEMNFSQQGANFKGKTWFSDDVPGGTVKMEVSSDGTVKSDTKMELTAIDKK